MEDVPVVRVWCEPLRSHGLVSYVKKKFFCYCCKKNYCQHSKKIKELCASNDTIIPALQELQELSEADEATESKPKANMTKCHSYRKIPFHMSEAGKAIFKNGVAQNIKMIAGQPVFVPGESICRHCGGNLNMEDPVAERWIASENVMFITNTFFGSGTCKA